ncbi:TonB-dependent receptor [Ramlibacter sp. PS4R-6]|uniref:TonB-dependent receptor n=1 Tax=Ramlibacter sp. PS4R-6 TaxID=3133438 RepID=UPI0030A2A36F
METNHTRFRRSAVARAALAALCGAGSLLAAHAQSTLERVEITGSAVRRVDAETALPVTVMKVEELRQQGFTTVEDIMQTLPGNQTSQGTAGSVGASTGGGVFANLRGLGANKTLVLLNGRRIVNQAVGGVGGGGDSSAPDLNTIPLAAIERIEVLRDGASSLYGTDAIGGVINFITKKDFQGGEVSAQYSHPQHPGGKVMQGNAGFGRGDLDKDGWNVFGFVDMQHQDVVTTPQRSFASAAKTSPTGFPGAWSQGGASISPFAPACAEKWQAPSGTTCAYYYWNWVDLVPKTDRITAMLKGTLNLGAHQASLEYTGSQTKVWTNFAPVPEGALTMNPSSPFFPGNGVTPLPPAGTVWDPTQPIRVRWRAVPAGPRSERNDSEQQRLVGALEGTVFGWDYATGITWNQVTTTRNLIGGYVDDNLIRDAVANGTLNPFTPTLPADQQAIVANAVLTGRLFTAKGETTTWDGRVSRELGDWFGAGRKAALGLGAELRHEKYTQFANTAYASSVVSSTGFDPFTVNQGARSVWGVYGELNLPVTKSLEVTGSVRYDHYPDFGSSTNPKVSFKFAPSDKWAVRGSASTGFRAPSLFELHSSQVFTNTANNWNDPARCPGGNPIPGVSRADNCAVQFMSLVGGNTALQPEKSRGATLGFVLQPVPAFDATVDFWWVHLKNSIGALSDATVFGDPATYAAHIVRAPDGSLATDGSQCNTAANPGPQCGYVLLLNDNLGDIKTSGVDLAANFRLRTGLGNWLFRLHETYVAKFRYQTERGGPWFDGVGLYSGNPSIAGGGPVFRNQFSVSAMWNMGQWGAGVVTHYKSAYLDQDVGQTVIDKVGAYQTWDLYGSWSSPDKKLSVTLGVKNVFDKKPPHSEQAATFQVGYDPRFADPLLRTFYVRGTYRF